VQQESKLYEFCPEFPLGLRTVLRKTDEAQLELHAAYELELYTFDNKCLLESA
jgi:hypothetical protein